MSDADSSNSADVHYVIEIDDSRHSEHVLFVEAIKAGLILREQNSQSIIRNCVTFPIPNQTTLYREWPPRPRLLFNHVRAICRVQV